MAKKKVEITGLQKASRPSSFFFNLFAWTPASATPSVSELPAFGPSAYISLGLRFHIRFHFQLHFKHCRYGFVELTELQLTCLLDFKMNHPNIPIPALNASQ